MELIYFIGREQKDKVVHNLPVLLVRLSIITSPMNCKCINAIEHAAACRMPYDIAL